MFKQQPQKELKDRYFIISNAGLFLDTSNKFTCRAPFDDNVYSSDDQASAQALVVSANLTKCSVELIPRFS